MALESLMPQQKSFIEGLRDWWGQRPYPRRTKGHVGRTRALAALYAAQQDAKALQDGRPKTISTEACKLELDGLEKLAEFLAHAWAGEEGWDTQQFIAAVKASTGGTPTSEPKGGLFGNK